MKSDNMWKWILGVALLFTLVGVTFLTTDLQSVIVGEPEVIYETGEDGSIYPVKITFDVECEEVQDCVDFFISQGEVPTAEDMETISCDNKCVVDLR